MQRNAAQDAASIPRGAARCRPAPLRTLTGNMMFHLFPLMPRLRPIRYCGPRTRGWIIDGAVGLANRYLFSIMSFRGDCRESSILDGAWLDDADTESDFPGPENGVPT